MIAAYVNITSKLRASFACCLKVHPPDLPGSAKLFGSSWGSPAATWLSMQLPHGPFEHNRCTSPFMSDVHFLRTYIELVHELTLVFDDKANRLALF